MAQFEGMNPAQRALIQQAIRAGNLGAVASLMNNADANERKLEMFQIAQGRAADRQAMAEERLKLARESLELRERVAALKQDQKKPLTNSDRDDLLKRANPALGLVRLTDTFKDEYGGKGAGWVGDMQNLFGRNVPGADASVQAQAQWWQDYNSFANLERNALFGSALTVAETANFNRAMINPGMTADQIKANLKRQRAIALNATSRIAHSLAESGIKKEAIEAAIGMKLDKLPPPIADLGDGDAPASAPDPVEAELRRRGLIK